VILYIILVFLGVLFEASTAPLPAALAALLLGEKENFKTRRFLMTGLLAGLILDIWLLRPIGITAGVFMGAQILILLYRRKIETQSLLYLLPFVGLTAGVYSLYFYGEWKIQVVFSITAVFLAKFLSFVKSKIW